MKSIEALLSFMFLIIASMPLLYSPPQHYDFSNYAYALANDFYNVVVYNSTTPYPEDYLILDGINKLESLSYSCISYYRMEENEKIGKNKECNFLNSVYSTTRCTTLISRKCYVFSIG